jgi:uncharacterized membrane protein
MQVTDVNKHLLQWWCGGQGMIASYALILYQQATDQAAKAIAVKEQCNNFLSGIPVG